MELWLALSAWVGDNRTEVVDSSGVSGSGVSFVRWLQGRWAIVSSGADTDGGLGLAVAYAGWELFDALIVKAVKRLLR